MLLSWERYEIQAEGITAHSVLNNIVGKMSILGNERFQLRGTHPYQVGRVP